MGFCKYCNIAPYDSFCTCQITNSLCNCVRRCADKQCYLPLDNMDNCIVAKNEKMNTNILFVKNNKIYVKLSNKDMVVVVPNIYGDNIPAWIDIVEIDNNFYIKGQEPKVEEKKTVKKSKKVRRDN